MRKITLLFVIILMASMVFAGGIVTNTNQSAMYVRTLNRNASTDLDAVYFNPAGLTSLENGLHIHFSNQSILQDKGVSKHQYFQMFLLLINTINLFYQVDLFLSVAVEVLNMKKDYHLFIDLLQV